MTSALYTTVADGVHAIDCPFEGVPLTVYVVQGDDLTLIDAGIASTPDDYVFPAVEALEATPADIGLLVNTHVHHDHRGGNAAVRRRNPAVRVAVPAREIPWAESRLRYVLQTQTAAFPGEFEPEPAACDRILALCGDDVVVDDGLEPGDVLTLGSARELHVIAAPGHSPGHVALHDREASVLFSGDVLQGDGCRVEDRPWLFPYYSSVDTYLASLDRIEAVGASVLCSAHYGALGADGAAGLLRESRGFTERLNLHVSRLLAERREVDLVSAVADTLAAFPGYRNTVGVYTTVAAHLDHAVRQGAATAFISGHGKRWRAS